MCVWLVSFENFLSLEGFSFSIPLGTLVKSHRRSLHGTWLSRATRVSIQVCRPSFRLQIVRRAIPNELSDFMDFMGEIEYSYETIQKQWRFYGFYGGRQIIRQECVWGDAVLEQ